MTENDMNNDVQVADEIENIECESSHDPKYEVQTKEVDGKKKVTFPPDSDIVTDYFETKGYWAENRFCSSDELISAYKMSCDHYNIKPVPILLEQLKGIDVEVCHERYDMLNLSNVKLELKQVECLEEVFKRVQFKTLNFENCGLDDESAASLFEIIEFYESCNRLILSLNSKISYSGFTACAKMLKKAPCLEMIEFKGIMFTDTTIPPLNKALRCGCHLKILHLENSNICSKNLLILSSALKLNIHLREVYLAHNRMVPSDGIQLGSLLKINRHIELIDVKNNSLGDVGLGHIADGICDQFLNMQNKPENEKPGKGLISLSLWCNSITCNGMPALSEALKASKNLQFLNIGNNPISSEGIHALREGLLSNRSLLRLSMPCCKITCEGGVAIAEYLADTKQLIRLDLRENDIKTAGLMAISHSMKINKSLTRLDIDQNPKRDANIRGYAESQLESLKIIQQRLSENRMLEISRTESELTQSLQSLSNQSELTAEINPDLASFSPGVSDGLQNSDTNPECENSQPEFISSNDLPLCPQIDDFSTNSANPCDNIQKPLYLDISIDNDASSDSPTMISNTFTNKVLSPTDKILDFSEVLLPIQVDVQISSATDEMAQDVVTVQSYEMHDDASKTAITNGTNSYCPVDEGEEMEIPE